MSRREYTTVGVPKGLKADLRQLKEDDETYAAVIRRALTNEGELREKEKSRHNFTHERLNEIARLQVRIADELGLEKEQIPRNMAEYEAWGSDSPFAPSDEQTTDVYSEEKADEHKQRALEQGFVNRTVLGDDGEPKHVRIEITGTDDDGKLIEGDREEIDPDENVLYGFSPNEDNNGGDQ